MRLGSYRGHPYRMHTPKWAIAPTSGEGAATHGGRLNRQGLPALYLSLDAATAIAEYKQTSTLMPPGTLVQYQVAIDPIVDFSGGYDGAWDDLWEELNCDWRKLWYNDHVEPPSWLLGDAALESGAKGILFHSLAGEGLNLVVFPEALGAEDTLAALDPGNRLPRNQDSWK